MKPSQTNLMNHNQQRGKKRRGKSKPVKGGGTLSVTLDQIVDYAKELDDRAEAERMELMCYRMFGRQLSPRDADKIAEIPEQFKKRRTPTIGKLISITNNGDNVAEKTVIPSVANFKPEIQRQSLNVPKPQIGEQGEKLIGE